MKRSETKELYQHLCEAPMRDITFLRKQLFHFKAGRSGFALIRIKALGLNNVNNKPRINIIAVKGKGVRETGF